MQRPSPWLYLWIFTGALVGSLVLTPLVCRFAQRFGIQDEPAVRKAHLEPVSLLGGLAIYGGTVVAAWTVAAGARTQLKGFFIAGFVMLIFGLQDDITPMDPWLKIAAQAASAMVLIGFGTQVKLTDVPVIDIALTVAWVVGVINAVNYQDNMNGLAAGLAATSSLGFFALAVISDQYLVAALALLVAGGCLGFLPFNYPRARIFMGDSGSMFLGLILAFLGIRLRFLDRPRSTTFLLPILVLAVPLFDAALVTISRQRRGVPVTSGGCDHSSHRLVCSGLRPSMAVATLWMVQALACLGAVALVAIDGMLDLLVLVAAALAVGLAARRLEREALTATLPSGSGTVQ